MLKWEHAYELAKDVVERNRADRWIVFIFFMLGLSITVHLLNLLTVPAIVMIYFYKKYTPTVRKSVITFLFSCILTGLILWGIVYFIPRTSAMFDRVFVNGFDLPFFTGFAFFFILLGVVLLVLIKDRCKARAWYSSPVCLVLCFYNAWIFYLRHYTYTFQCKSRNRHE